MAKLHSTPLGCVALKFHKKSPVEPRECEGARLLEDLMSAGDDEAENYVLQTGVHVIRLGTNRTLH